jgi:hypothetical protein
MDYDPIISPSLRRQHFLWPLNFAQIAMTKNTDLVKLKCAILACDRFVPNLIPDWKMSRSRFAE